MHFWLRQLCSKVLIHVSFIFQVMQAILCSNNQRIAYTLDALYLSNFKTCRNSTRWHFDSVASSNIPVDGPVFIVSNDVLIVCHLVNVHDLLPRNLTNLDRILNRFHFPITKDKAVRLQ